MENILRVCEAKGFIDKLIISDNILNRLGSRSHKKGIAQSVKYFEGNTVIIMDCDMLVQQRGWVPKLVKKAQQHALYGVKHLNRLYVHPALMVVQRDTLSRYVSDIESAEGDTLEFLSKKIPNKGFLEGKFITDEKKPKVKLGEELYIDKEKIAFHMWYDWLQGPEQEAYLRQHYIHQYAVIIPVYGRYRACIKKVKQQCEQLGLPTYQICGGYNRKKYEEDVEVLSDADIHSRSGLLNYGFINVCAERYIFHDRDIQVGEEWWKQIQACEKPVFICHDGVWYQEHTALEKGSEGGSNCVNWDFFLEAGGFDYEMIESLEDREFNYRCLQLLRHQSFLAKKDEPMPRLSVTLDHIDHPRHLLWDNGYKRSVRKQMGAGTLNTKNRKSYIWDQYKESWRN